jgi:hypothetical protein
MEFGKKERVLNYSCQIYHLPITANRDVGAKRNNA